MQTDQRGPGSLLWLRLTEENFARLDGTAGHLRGCGRADENPGLERPQISPCCGVPALAEVLLDVVHGLALDAKLCIVPVGTVAEGMLERVPSIPVEGAQIDSSHIGNTPVDRDRLLMMVMAEPRLSVQLAPHARCDPQEGPARSLD